MTLRMRRVAVVVLFAVASTALVATTPAYTVIGGEQSEIISLGPDAPAALRSFSIVLSPAALPDIEALVASRTYGQVIVAFPDDAAGVEVAVAETGVARPPTFVPAPGEHVVLDVNDCDVLRECRHGVDVVVRLAEGAAATDVSLTVRSRVYYPASSLPEGASLTYQGLDVPAKAVSVHVVESEASGDAQLDAGRPLDMTIRYTPTSATLLRLHGGQVSGRYETTAPPASGASATASAATAAPTTLNVELRRGATVVDQVRLAPLETISRPITPLAGCLANCALTYRLVLTPSPAPADPASRLTWQASAWVFVLTEPDGTAPRLELEAAQAPAGG
jgi:hypothetical protein